ncbi:cupin domain-containing protein [Patescibacteria group bacterium]|nr:cupin domain-containing protein [Patescibacteria group bacterium]MCL5797998.1 cupin domain-containing protein [Patescibacteria group bacterium]
MKPQIIRGNMLKFIPAGHEDPKNPSVLKKVLISFGEQRIKGRIQMINWAKLLAGKNFTPHYHEDMDEIFIILSGRNIRVKVGSLSDVLYQGDAIFIPRKTVHRMDNNSNKDMDYIALGVSSGNAVKL